jgi:hypothetical protein
LSTDLNSWIGINLRSSAAFDKSEEVQGLIDKNLAQQIERNIRTRVDPGINKKAAIVAEGVKVKSEDGQFVIYSESQGDVLRAASKQFAESSGGIDAGSMEDLFSQSSGVPEAEDGPDGTKLVFKRISVEKLLGEQRENAQKHMTEQAVTETVRNGIVDAYDQAFAEIDRRHPTSK